MTRTQRRLERRAATIAALFALGTLANPLRAQSIALNVGTAPQLQVLPGATVAIPIEANLAGAAGINIASLNSGIVWNTLSGGFAFSTLVVGGNGAIGWSFAPTTTGAPPAGSVSFLTSHATTNLPATNTVAIASFTASVPAVGVERGTRIFLAPTAAANAASASVLAALRPRYLDVCISEGKWGDVNNDNNVNIVDAQQMARKSVGLSVANPTTTTLRGDVTASGGVEPNITDAQQTARFSVLLSAAARLGTGTFTTPAVATHALSPSTAQSIAVGSTVQITHTPLTAGAVDITGCAGSTWETSDPAIATVNASGLVTGVSGGTVTITSRSTINVGITATLSVTVTGGANPCAPAAATVITIGQTVNGALANTDCPLAGGKFADFYSLTVASSSTIQIEMTGNPLNTFLSLANSTNSDPTIVDNDTFTPVYASAGFHARINRTITAGTYIIRATSSGGGATGAYTLRVCDAAPTTITVGQTLGGTIAATDCDLGDGTRFDRFTFTLAQAMTVTLTQSSGAVTPYLFLLNSSESTPVLAESGSGVISAPLSVGTYVVWANTASTGQFGAYTLGLTGNVNNCAASTAIATAQTINSSIDGTDCLLSDGTRTERYQLVLAAPTALRIDETSAAFDAFLFMQDASGNTVAANDDGAGGTNARIEGTFPAGTYVIYANTFTPGAVGAYTIQTSALPGGAVNLVVDRIYLTQPTQRFNGTVPLVAARDAFLRVFVRANQANAATPSVRVQTYNSVGTLLNTRTITAPVGMTSVPTVLNEASLSSSWNVYIPAAEIAVSMRIDVTVDPTNAIVESNETDNNWPPASTGTFATARVLDVRAMPTRYITMIPINQGANLSALTGVNMDSYLSMTRKVWPLSTVSPVLGATYTSTAAPVLSDGTNWSPLLSEILTLRTNAGSGRHYYGIMKATYGSGVAGLGYIGLPAAIGWDFLPSGDGVAAHELGHNFNRTHAPCGGPANPDVNFPYTNAAIGVYGYDLNPNLVTPPVLFAPTAPDLMSYCHPEWISDYTYTSAMSFILANPSSPVVVNAEPGIMVWGRIENGQMILEPAFETNAPPTPLRSGGAYRLTATSETGSQVLSFTFTPAEVADLPTRTQHFAFVIAKSTLGTGALASLQLSGPGTAGAVTRTTSAAIANAAIVNTSASASRVTAGRVEVRWDAARFPLAVVRSVATGEILSLARGGVVTVPNSEAEIEVTLSDGVRSAVRRIAPQ